MLMLDSWTPSQAKKKLRDRLQFGRQFKERHLNRQWERNEYTAYNTEGGGSSGSEDNVEIDGNGNASEGREEARTGVNYSFKNLRFIHAQMSANPPTAIPRPSTSDPEDRRAARAADAILRHSLRQYDLQEVFDQSNLNTLTYGTGIIKTIWSPFKGDIIGFKKTGQVIQEGDIDVTSVHPSRMIIDSDAETRAQVRYVFEEITLSYEEALHRWPKKKELLNSLLSERGQASVSNGLVLAGVSRHEKNESLTVYEYWETGLPSNAMLGRYTVCLEDGRLLQPITSNPFSFITPPTTTERDRARRKGVDVRRGLPTARLPYHFLTDIDVPNRVWGRSFLEYEAPLQDLMNRIDSLMLEALQAHGVARLILPDGIDFAEESITNSSWDIVRLRNKDVGNTGEPKFMEPMPLPQVVTQLREQTRVGLDDMGGVNESMFGQQSREQSGYSMQYATNQGNLIRRRLFNKYVAQVEAVYKGILDLVRKHWVEERTIQVLGNEKAFQVLDLTGSSIDGGFDFVVEYGTSLSLDPMTRRQEIMNMMPILEKAGIPPRVIIGMLKLGELDVIDDMVQLADDRQREIIDKMVATGAYIAPEEFQDHENMIGFCLRYVMSAEFQFLEPEEKELIRKHIRDRGAAAAPPQQAAGTPGPMGTPAETPGTTGAPPLEVLPPGATDMLG